MPVARRGRNLNGGGLAAEPTAGNRHPLVPFTPVSSAVRDSSFTHARQPAFWVGEITRATADRTRWNQWVPVASRGLIRNSGWDKAKPPGMYPGALHNYRNEEVILKPKGY